MSQELTDTALLKSWTRRRDADAFCALTNRYGRVVFAASLRVLGNTTDAEDVTQECFEKLAATSRAPGDYLGAWLHRIATNRALDMLRAQTRRTARETSYAEDLSTQSDPDWQEIYPRVDEAVNALPDKYRRAIVAHYLCGKTHEAIAAQEGVTRSAVTRRLKRGLELLKAHLSKQGVTLSASVFAAFYGSDVLRAAEIPVKLASDLGRIALSGAAMPVVPAFAWSLLVKGAVSLAGIILVMMGALTTYRALNPDPISDESQLPLTLTAATDEIQTNAQPEEVLQPPSQIIVASNLELATRAETLTASVQSEPNVSGHVTDAVTGQGISGALIKAYTQSGRQEVRTDQDGYFEFRDLPEGQCGIGCREANGYLVTNPFHDTGDGGFTSVAPHKILEVEADQQRIADFQLSRGQSLQGRVVDESGSPLEGILVTAGANINQYHIKNTAISDADGRVVVSGFPPTQSLYVWADGERITSRIHGPFVMPDETERELVLLPEAIIRGRVVDQAGRGLNDMRISPQFEKSASIRTISTNSDESGNFELRGLFPGIHIMRVVAKEGIIANSPAGRITVVAGEVVENLEFVCNVGSYVIAGRVLNQTGEPIVYARIELRGASSSNRTPTSSDGFFEFNNLLYDTYRVDVDTSTDKYLPTQIDGVEAGTRGLTIVLQDAFQVSGVVIDGETGDAITDYEIKDCFGPRSMILDQRYRRQQSEDGAFSVRVNQIRTTRIAARAEGYLLGYVVVELNETTTHVPPQTIRLKRQPALQGVVRTQDGEPIEGALIFSGGETGGNEPDNYASARTLADGSFILPARKLGHDFITILHRGYPNARLMLEEQHYAGTPVEVTLYAGTVLFTTVTLNGSPLPDVYVRELAGGPQPGALTGEDGHVRLNSLEPGTYTIQANAPWEILPVGRSLLEREVELEGGKHTDLDIEFFSGTASLSGAILGKASSASLKLVFFEHDTPQTISMYAGFDGMPDSYLFSNLPAAPARLEVVIEPEGQTNGIMKKDYELDFSAGGEITFDINPRGEVTLEAHAPPLTGGEQVMLTVRYGSDPNAKSDFSSRSDDWLSFCTTTMPQADSIIIIPNLDAGAYSLVLSRYRENAAGETFLDAEQVLLVELTQPNETVVFPDW